VTEVSIHVDAPPERVWHTLVAVEQWPELTPSVTSVESLDGTGLEPGRRFRVTQPRLGTAVWRVTEVVPPRAFTWSTSRAGVTTTGIHQVLARPAGGSDVTLTIEHRGALAPLVRLLYGRLTRRYMELEAVGLKRRSESSAS